MALWKLRSATPVTNILELGIHDGGSVAFWFELLQPDKYVALDIAAWGDTEYFNKYVASRKLENRIKTFWKTDQGDRETLCQIVAAEFNGPLDLIIDDASHLYSATRTSFETLFPLLRKGGLYIIEDWSWGCWPDLPVDFLPAGTELPKLVHQIVNAVGSMSMFLSGDPEKANQMTLKPLISNVTTYPDIVVVERGDAEVSDFDLERYITCRPPGSISRRCFARIRYAASKWAHSHGSKPRKHLTTGTQA